MLWVGILSPADIFLVINQVKTLLTSISRSSEYAGKAKWTPSVKIFVVIPLVGLSTAEKKKSVPQQQILEGRKEKEAPCQGRKAQTPHP